MPIDLIQLEIQLLDTNADVITSIIINRVRDQCRSLFGGRKD